MGATKNTSKARKSNKGASKAQQAQTTNDETTSAAPVVVVKSAREMLLTSSNATNDVLKGRVGARTHALHIALVESHLAGAPVSTKQLTARATALLAEIGAPPCNATNAHLHTMQARKFIVRVNGAWALTEDAIALLLK